MVINRAKFDVCISSSFRGVKTDSHTDRILRFICLEQNVLLAPSCYNDRERLISEKRNSKASAEDARLPKEAMLLRDVYKFTKPSLDAFCPFALISRACQGPRNAPTALTLTLKKI